MKLGAIHRRQPLAIRPLSKRASLHLMTPPKSVDWHKACPPDGDALSNDRFGCCVEVADWRVIQMRKSNVWGDDSKPLVSDILARYTMLSGFNIVSGTPDNGTDTVDDLTSWCTHGIQIADQTLDCPSWCMAHPQDATEVNLAIAHAGPVLVTLALPLAAQDTETWAQAPGTGSQWVAGSWGCHRVMTGKYDQDTRVLRSWGQDIEVHPEWFNAYAISVDVLISRDWLRTTGLTPSGLDFDALRNDIASL
jgi:hypothetical protein